MKNLNNIINLSQLCKEFVSTLNYAQNKKQKFKYKKLKHEIRTKKIRISSQLYKEFVSIMHNIKNIISNRKIKTQNQSKKKKKTQIQFKDTKWE